MKYYAVQIRTGQESKIIQLMEKEITLREIQCTHLYFPQKVLYIRKGGRQHKVTVPIFPGYFFFAVEKLKPALYQLIRHTPGFFRFLPNSETPHPLDNHDTSILKHFLSFGEIANPSKVYFNDEDRICVIEGIMKGLQGQIVKVDKRKRRAKIKLDMNSGSFTVDLAFDIMQQAEKTSEHKKEITP